MGSSDDGPPVGPVLAVGGLVAIGVGVQRVYAAGTVDAVLAAGVVPVVLGGAALAGIGYRVSQLHEPVDRVLWWAAGAALATGTTVAAALYGTGLVDAPLASWFVALAVGTVAAAGGAAAGLLETRRRGDLARLERRAERAEATLHAVRGSAVIQLDPEGYVDTWSEGASEVTGFSHTDMVGVRLDALYPGDAEREVNRDLQRALKDRRVDLEREFRRADGETFYGRGSITAVQTPDALLGYVVVLADRSEERARREQLERRNQQLEAFASVVSHDLRNPLNVAIGSISMARKDHEDDDALQTAESALERMERLIEEVLALARQGKDVDEFERVELEECVQLAWSSVDEMWADLSYGDLPAVTADGERLRRLFENLFRNAIEHAGQEASIRVGMLPNDDGFYVEDDGPGIPDHKREEVFEAGYTTGEDGTGLGLAIVKSIAEAHGWEIQATGGPEGGARFEIRGVQVLAEV